jgi:hypothetical protein
MADQHGHARVEAREKAALLVLELLVERLAGNAGARRHVADRRCRVPLLADDVGHRVEDPAALRRTDELSREMVPAVRQAEVVT